MVSVLYAYVPLAWLVSQLTKTAIDSVRSRHAMPKRFIYPGGMPSAHSALVSALVTAVGISEGFNTSIFSVTLIFSLIIIYDAWGHQTLRRHSALQIFTGVVVGVLTIVFAAIGHGLS